MNYKVKLAVTEIVTLQVTAAGTEEAVKLATEAYKQYLKDSKTTCKTLTVCRNEERKVNIHSVTPASFRLPFTEVVNLFREINKAGLQPISAYIVFNEDNWNKAYSQESRTYEISSDNKYFQAGMNGSSIFGSCLDGTDQNIRLDCYLFGGCAWRIEDCYISEDDYNSVIARLADKYCN